MVYIAPGMIVLVILGIFIYFWCDIQKRNRVQRAEEEKREAERQQGEAEYRKLRARVRTYRAATVATPREQAVIPDTRKPQEPYDNVTSALDVANGYTVGKIFSISDSASSPTDFASDGGGDFGGGGAESSWDTPDLS